ncbi:hypothetical protein N7462_007165 [Penicillium macrosclerotiorum]|uniref:uncharacterized protein n=1 Tax=Penicillium macrosclerotiorum TaxID=303699 RepID=UPI0025499169|nr:uncharacterized protein N7462_007165 [Penicillium macrosclerotiorum]KAJ5678921.1 hypothetical protein N7462_007165 [Penicillium macrosclerotiorum]
MESERGAVYCTLLLSDHYLPGAMVLAHSLRDNGTRARLIALFTPDRLQAATINELRTVYDELIPVISVVNDTPANLWLMDRPDLIATFTKIELWRLTQFDRVVYIDCDVVALRAPDELLSLEADFAAAPDVGWPDCFNSGVMVLRPNMQDYYALKALATRGISFDGADQGLLNMHFRDWHRLSFTYNCTPSANYQYIPAYKHFQSTISLIHFIGSQKPWNLPRQVVPLESPYNQLLGMWWAIYDKHYRPPFVSISQPSSGLPPSQPQASQDVSTAEYIQTVAPSHPEWTASTRETQKAFQEEQWPTRHHIEYAKESAPDSYFQEAIQSQEEAPAFFSVHHQTEHPPWNDHMEHHVESHHDHPPAPPAATASYSEMPVLSAVPQYVRGEEHVSTYVPPVSYAPMPVFEAQPPASLPEPPQEHHGPQSAGFESHIHEPKSAAPELSPKVTETYQPPPSEPEPEIPSFEAPKAEWDASREPPPLNSKPEGISLQQKTYTMSEDINLFQPPPAYPEAPKNMYYQVPTTKPEPEKLTQVFPWESRAAKPTRVFAHEQPAPSHSSPEQVGSIQPTSSSPPWETSSPKTQAYEPSADSWETYTRSNAWDEDPDIQRYIESIQQARRARTQVISGSSHHQSSSISTDTSQQTFSSATTATTGYPLGGHRPSIKLTDFPTEVERPSLPVTPAPIHRQPRASTDEDNEAFGATGLPIAEGVPNQEDWNPLARLEELCRRQSEVLEHPARLVNLLSALANAPSSHPGQDTTSFTSANDRDS